MLHERTGAHFQTTRSTLLHRLRSDDGRERERAMEGAIRLYWPAVYAAFRRRGCDRELAAELTQAFFSEVVVGRELLARYDGGSVRALLKTAIRNFHIDELRRKGRSAGVLTLACEDVDREEQRLAGSRSGEPGDAFDRRWAVGVLEEAVRRCEAYYRERGLARNWEAFSARVLRPASGCVRPPELAALAAELGWETPADVAAAVQVVKRRLNLILQEVAAESSGGGCEAEELALLAEVLG